MIRAQWERWKNQVFPSGFMWPTQPSPIQSLAGLNSVLPKQKKTGGKKKSQRKVTVTTDRKSAQIHIRFFMNSGHITSGIWLLEKQFKEVLSMTEKWEKKLSSGSRQETEVSTKYRSPVSHILQDSNQNHILDYCSPPITDQTGWSDITLKLSTSEVIKIHHHIKLECAAGNTDANRLLIPWWLRQPSIADTCRYITKLKNNYLKTGNIPRFEPSIHRGPTLQFTGCKGPTVKHLNGSHFQASVGQSCFSSVKATYTILCRWFSCCGWWVLGLVFHLMSLCLCSTFHTLHFISFTTCQAFFFLLEIYSSPSNSPSCIIRRRLLEM